MRPTVAKPLELSTGWRSAVALRRQSQYCKPCIRISGLQSVNPYDRRFRPMSAPVSPGMFRTNSGVPLPLVALPQDDLLTVNIDQIPLLKDAMGPGIHI